MKLFLVTALYLGVSSCGNDVTRSFTSERADLVQDSDRYQIRAEGAFIAHLGLRPKDFEPDALAGAQQLPAWMLPATSTLEFEVPLHLTGELVIEGGFGVDFDAQKRLPAGFKAQVEGQLERLTDTGSDLLFRCQLDVRGKQPIPVGWNLIRSEENDFIRVFAGDRLRLSTKILSSVNQQAKESLLASNPNIGVGGLRILERQVTKTKPGTPKQPNVIVVLMDTLGAARTSTYGHNKATTPNLDTLAARGTVYDDARSTSSWTWPSTASVLTGLLPNQHGVVNPGSSWLEADLETLAERMQAAGLVTAAFTGNRLISADFHFDQGFDTFHGPNRSEFIDGSELMPPALTWLKEHVDQRFFLYLHLADPHLPHKPLPESLAAIPNKKPDSLPKLRIKDLAVELYRESTMIEDRFERPLLNSHLSREDLEWFDASQDQAIHTGDVWLGKLIKQLEDLELDENTVVVFTSDHGEEYYEHGDFLHSQSLYPELVDVPLVIAGPGVSRGQRIKGIVSNARLFNYLSGLADDGVTYSERPPLADPNGIVFYSTTRGLWNGERGQRITGIEVQGWALHVQPETQDRRLYQLDKDPQQHHDVAAEFPGVVERLLALLDQQKQAARSRKDGTKSLGVGAGTIEVLTDLGYL